MGQRINLNPLIHQKKKKMAKNEILQTSFTIPFGLINVESVFGHKTKTKTKNKKSKQRGTIVHGCISKPASQPAIHHLILHFRKDNFFIKVSNSMYAGSVFVSFSRKKKT